MHAYQRVLPGAGVAHEEYAVHRHRRREVRKQRLRMLCPQLICQLLDLRQLRIADTGVPRNVEVPAARRDRHRDRPEDADRLAAALFVRTELAPFPVYPYQLALCNQALADGGVEVGKHGPAL